MALGATDVATQQTRCVDEVLAVLSRHDPEAAERIDLLFQRGAQKWSPRSGVVTPQDELLTILCEAVAVLAKTVDQQVEANKQPKKRGRKPNVEFKDS